MTAQSWMLPEELRQLADSGETGLVAEVLAVFQSDTAERVAAIRAAADAGNRVELRKQGHALKGSSGQVGAAALAGLCKSLEASAATASLPEIAAIVAAISAEFDEVCRQIRADHPESQS